MCQQKLLKSKLGENWFFFVYPSLPLDEDVHKMIGFVPHGSRPWETK